MNEVTPSSNLILKSLPTSSYGHYQVSVYDDDACQEIGKFITTNDGAHDDINSLAKGNVDALRNFEFEEELKEWALKHVKQSPDDDSDEASSAEYDLDNHNHAENFKAFCQNQISESVKTWTNPKEVFKLDYLEYFGPCIDSDLALHNNPDFGPGNLLVNQEHYDKASQLYLAARNEEELRFLEDRILNQNTDTQ